MTTTTIKAGDYSLTKYPYTHSISRWTPRHYSVLSEEHSLGIIEGLEIWIGINWLYSNAPELKNPDDAKFFEGYTKEQLSRFKKDWDSGISAEYYRHKKNLHEKERWGLAGITLLAFANGIQIGDKEDIAKYTEIGYAPSLNADDFGDPTYLDETGAIRNWVENNPETILKFAKDKRIEALKFINDTLKKLNK